MGHSQLQKRPMLWFDPFHAHHNHAPSRPKNLVSPTGWARLRNPWCLVGGAHSVWVVLIVCSFWLSCKLSKTDWQDQSEPTPATRMSQQIQKWIPVGTSLTSAEQILEQHHFTCVVDSYDRRAAMPPGSDTLRWDTGIVRNGISAAVTNISILKCEWTDTSDNSRRYRARLTAINGEIEGSLTVTSGLR
jgi:hypothetical protein